MEKGAMRRGMKILIVSAKQKYVCRFSEIASESCLAPTGKFGVRSVMMPECFGGIWPGNLIQIKGIM